MSFIHKLNEIIGIGEWVEKDGTYECNLSAEGKTVTVRIYENKNSWGWCVYQEGVNLDSCWEHPTKEGAAHNLVKVLHDGEWSAVRAAVDEIFFHSGVKSLEKITRTKWQLDAAKEFFTDLTGYEDWVRVYLKDGTWWCEMPISEKNYVTGKGPTPAAAVRDGLGNANSSIRIKAAQAIIALYREQRDKENK